MVERYNKNANPLNLSVGDYVYMLTEQTGQGRKFQPKYTGPLVIHKIVSDHMVSMLQIPKHCQGWQFLILWHFRLYARSVKSNLLAREHAKLCLIILSNYAIRRQANFLKMMYI
jgi:hypothetical protein